MGGGYAGGQLHADVHDRFHGAVEEELKPFRAQHIGNLMRVADSGGDTIGQNATVEFMRRDERGFDMQMSIDETRNNDFSGNVYFADAFIGSTGANDGIPANSNVRGDQLSGHEVEKATALENQLCRLSASTLVDARF